MSAIRREFIEHISNEGLTQAAVAKALGVSGTQINQYIKGIYKGDIAGLEENISRYLKRASERDSYGRFEIKEIETLEPTRLGAEVCRLVQYDSEIGVLVGDAGTGKTIAIKRYVAENPSTILIEVNQTFNKRVLIHRLANAVGANIKAGLNDIYDAVVGRLKGSGRLIIIDEAEYLSVNQLEILRRLHDNCLDATGRGIGLLLVGLPRLVSNLTGKRGEFAQMYSRVSVFCKIKPLSEKQVGEFLEASIKQRDMAPVFHSYSKGNLRLLSKLISRVDRICKINKVKLVDINEELVAKALQTLIY